MTRVEAWGSDHPVALNVANLGVFLAVFLAVGTLTNLALGGGVPWFGLAVSIAVWAVMTFWRHWRCGASS